MQTMFQGWIFDNVSESVDSVNMHALLKTFQTGIMIVCNQRDSWNQCNLTILLLCWEFCV